MLLTQCLVPVLATAILLLVAGDSAGNGLLFASVSALLSCFDTLLSAQEQPKAEAKETKPAKPEDMETEPNGNVAPETTAEPVVEDPMEQ